MRVIRAIILRPKQIRSEHFWALHAYQLNFLGDKKQNERPIFHWPKKLVVMRTHTPHPMATYEYAITDILGTAEENVDTPSFFFTPFFPPKMNVCG